MAATGEAIVCEGYTDVIAMHEAGFTNTVAALGTAFRLDHVRLMERQRVSRIVCLFDGDAAGQRAAERAVRYLDQTSAALLCVVLPDNLDPMEFLSERGADALRAVLDGARPLMEFVFEKRLSAHDLSAPGRRVRALQDMASLLAPLKRSVLLDEYATRLADILGMDVEQTKRAICDAPVRDLDEAAPATAARARRASVPERGEEHSSADYAPAPDDYLPLEATDAAPAPAAGAPLAALSSDERMQVAAERELLSAIATRPDEMRGYGERIASLNWCDERHEAMAWAMLSTPDGSAPSDVVAAATAVVPEAPRLLSGGRVMGESELSEQKRLDLIVDTAELLSSRRRIRQIRARLKGSLPDEASAEALFAEATALQRRATELSRALSSVSSE